MEEVSFVDFMVVYFVIFFCINLSKIRIDESLLFLLKGDVLMEQILNLWYMGTDLCSSTDRVPHAIGLIACR